MTLRIEHADILDWDWPEAAFDVVVAIFFQFAGPAERDKIFAGIKKALKPGGLLLLEGYGPEAARIQDRRAGPDSRISTRARCWNRPSPISPSIEVREYDAT